MRADIALPAALSLEGVAERRAVLALAAQGAGVPVPRLVAGVPCGPECIVLAYDRSTARPSTSRPTASSPSCGATWPNCIVDGSPIAV